ELMADEVLLRPLQRLMYRTEPENPDPVRRRQLADDAAKAEGERLKQKHSDVLGKLTVSIMRADLGAKGVFYRIRLGPARDKDQARAVCAQLAKRGQGCLVIAPGK
ncbi:MAG: SPOR domain-containing protein, partial [Rhodospirillales bacterium]